MPSLVALDFGNKNVDFFVCVPITP